MIDFPINPTSGQTYSYNNTNYTFNGIGWVYTLYIKGITGSVGATGNGISSITQPSGPSTAQINYTDGSTSSITLPQGVTGNGISSITQPSGPGTALITYTNATTNTINLPGGVPNSCFAHEFSTHFINGTRYTQTVAGIYSAIDGFTLLEGQFGANDSVNIVASASGLTGPGILRFNALNGNNAPIAYRGGNIGPSVTAFGAIPFLSMENGEINIYFACSLATLFTTADNAICGFRLGDSVVTGTIPTNCIEMQLARNASDTDTRWIGRTTAGGVSTGITASSTITTNTAYAIRIQIINTGTRTVRFYINGTQLGTDVTTNIPDNSVYLTPYFYLRKTAGASLSRVFFVDYYGETQIIPNPYTF